MVMGDEEYNIKQRLNSLKSNDKSTQNMDTLEVLEMRLRNLKGHNLISQMPTPSASIKSPDDLILQMTELVKLENNNCPAGVEDNLASRLANLYDKKNMNISQLNDYSATFHQLSEKEQVDKIMKSAFGEIEIKRKVESGSDSDSLESLNDSSTIIECSVCNDPAILCCKDCNNLNYCSICFDDYHDTLDDENHSVKFFK